MSKISIYHNPRCQKSRQTLDLLKESGQEPEVIEYLKTPPTEAELSSVIKKLGIKPIELVRKGEELFKLNYKDKSLSDTEWIKVMVENPILIERPIVIKDKKAIIGRPPELVKELL